MRTLLSATLALTLLTSTMSAPLNLPRIDKPNRNLKNNNDPELSDIYDVLDHLVGKWSGGGLFQLFKPQSFQTNLEQFVPPDFALLDPIPKDTVNTLRP